MLKQLIFGVALLGFATRGHAQAAGHVIDRIVCAADASQSYALYIPVRGDQQPLPIMYFFDSHGVGSLPLRKYKVLADTYGFILAGSNNSKNGNDWPTTGAIWNRLFADTRKRLKINEQRIYTCGFSGGAKVASYIAIEHSQIKGVIANGAGLPDGVSAGDFPFSFTAIAGEGDMNMTDLAGLNGELDRTRTRHRILYFSGKHEWAPVTTMRTAFAGLDLDAMAIGLLPRNAAAIGTFVAGSKQHVSGDIRSKDLIAARQACAVAVSYLNGLSDETSWFQRQAANLDRDPAYIKQRDARSHLLTIEENTKAEYMQHFQQGDMQYWTSTIDGLKAKVAAKTAASGMYQRLLAYLSLAFYSISNQLINGNQNEGARHFVELYKLADPTNSEAWYFSAILDARERNGHAATADLLTAAKEGFTDKGRLRQQLEFRQLAAQIDLARIESWMH
jgi:pimeloyl-ACP methyl ester carboxylesterase